MDLSNEKKNSRISLNMSQEWTRLKQEKNENDMIKKLGVPSLFISIPTANLKELSADKKEVVKDWYSQIVKDPSVEEAARILEDFPVERKLDYAKKN